LGKKILPQMNTFLKRPPLGFSWGGICPARSTIPWTILGF